MDSEDLRIPGDRIKTVEEIMGGAGTFEEEGVVYSSVFGKLVMDSEDLLVEIKSGAISNRFLMGGDMVVCRVISITGHDAELRVLRKLGPRREMPAPLSCELRISDASNEYVHLMEDAVRVNDIIVGDVVRGYPSVLIGIISEKTGVIYAECQECGGSLERVGDNRIGCGECDISRSGTLSSMYGECELFDLLPW